MPFLFKNFKTLIPDLQREEIEEAFYLAYVNTWGFHIPGQNPSLFL
jgi:hypothetical protein